MQYSGTMKINTSKLSEEIRVELARRKLRKADLADVLGVSRSTITRAIEHEKTPSAGLMLALAEWLDRSPYDFTAR